jgi:hypothetical protein
MTIGFSTRLANPAACKTNSSSIMIHVVKKNAVRVAARVSHIKSSRNAPRIFVRAVNGEGKA